ncbi:putative Lysine/arginine/ornithine-binding periplasmic protein [Rhodovastum atsumiense]|uniref:transporter substrate-binding domain-containing protein n=1 Tax=Rhodovastum atsumiense TaxID=504468 RepID=UPI001EF1550D|nr:transporter substrate-binding domain-containing protein [Rhodovastum atsumiense]CAH2603886.1 putative Lysine/arginine/ornithine-binding periplasmic protein [Rhodovastum atsumiense]
MIPTFRRLSTALLLSALALPPIAARAAGPDLKTALDGTFAPHAMPTLSGGIEGFNVDLANLIAERLGRKITITAAEFSGLIPALQAGTYDFLAAPVTVNPERAANLLFSEGFMDADFRFLARKSAPDYKTFADLKGKVIAVNKGSNYDAFAREHAAEYGWTVESYGTNSDAVAAVLAGRADVNFAGVTVVAWAVKKNPALKLSFAVPSGQVWSLAFRKDDTTTRNLVDRAIECLKIDGSMAKLSQKWFGITPEPGQTIVTPVKGYGVPGFAGYVADEHKPSCTDLH